MSPDKLKTILQDVRRLHAAISDPELLPVLPVTWETVRALPIQLAPFQAKWLFGNCRDETLADMRELHPAIVVQRFGTGTGTRYRYSKIEVCKAGAIPCEEFGVKHSTTDRHR